ncbi:MAG: hypothetical protein RL373_1267, partial [Pseudomonadota bacterium]
MNPNNIQQLRKELLEQRQFLAHDTTLYSSIVLQIHEHVLIALNAFAHIQTIALYWPIRGEPDIRSVLMDWCGQNPKRRLALPITKKNQPLTFHEWAFDTEMKPGLANIPEPFQTPVIEPDLIFAPCLGWQGFDQRFWRLGYGGGYYDRSFADYALVANPPIFLGISLEEFQLSPVQW